jgi:hypothetical protein
VALPQTIARSAKVCVSDEVDRPTVIGFFAPKIVIPEWLIPKLSPAELEQVVLHEAGHLSRHDDWLNLLQKIALVVFPLNPVLAWVERRLCFERELACDERVLNVTGAPKAYAQCLAALAEYRLERRGLVRELALALGALGRESELAQRVLRILSGGGRMKRSHARLVLGGSMLTLVFAASALEHSPQLVGFTHADESATAVRPSIAAATPAGLRAVAVRANVKPAEQWKTVGDATPHIAKRAAVKMPDAPVEAVVRQGESVEASELAVSAPAPRRRAAYQPAHMVQTVATTRQVSGDGDVVVTRWVSVTWNASSNADGGRSVSDSQADPAEQQQVRPYAAVPVQGGWLVFQL